MWDGIERRIGQRRVHQDIIDNMNQYNEQLVLVFQQLVMDTYREAGQALDLSNVVWSARMQYDAATTMSYSASTNKHLAELRKELGLG